jgi:hypothetical protein
VLLRPLVRKAVAWRVCGGSEGAREEDFVLLLEGEETNGMRHAKGYAFTNEIYAGGEGDGILGLFLTLPSLISPFHCPS